MVRHGLLSDLKRNSSALMRNVTFVKTCSGQVLPESACGKIPMFRLPARPGGLTIPIETPLGGGCMMLNTFAALGAALFFRGSGLGSKWWRSCA